MFSLTTLGRLSLEKDGAPVPVLDGRRKGVTILVILAAQGRVRRDRLMTLLWPDSDAGHAGSSLRQVLHQLRHDLLSPDLFLGSSDLQLNPAVITTDITRFTDALTRGDDASAAALYAGPFLDGVELNGGSELEHWVDGLRADLARRWAGAVERLADRAEQAGDFRRSAELWRQRHEREPTDGQTAVRLMLALDRSGQRTAALRQATLHQQRLREDWELPPDPSVAKLAEQWRAAAPPLMAAPSALRSNPDPPAAAGSASVRTRSFAPWLLGAAATLALLVGAAGWALRAPEEVRDPTLVAVAPFHVMDTSLALWREGLADILTRDLDGAGPLRTVTGPVPFKDWPGGANRSAADDLGHRTGAGVVVFGSIARIGADTVALRTTVLDRSGNAAADLEVRGPESRMGVLSDSLVLGILKILGRDRPIASATSVSLGARSLPALKEFLRGEQYYRRGMWDSALVHYDRALAQDSAFGLAFRRVAYTSSWGVNSSGGQANFNRLIARAVALNHGLAPRDSLLLLADSLELASRSARDPHTFVFAVNRALALLEEAARRYPLDPDIWFELAERSYHLPPPLRPPAEQTLAAIDRAIALDPAFGPAYEHAIDLALQLRDRQRAARYARAGASLAPSAQSSSFQLAQLIFDSGAGSPAVMLALRQASANTLLRTGAEYLGWATDSGEAALTVLQVLAEGQASQVGAGPMVTDSLLRPRHLAWAQAFRGHLVAAGAGLRSRPVASGPGAALLDPFLDLALFGAMPDSVAAPAFAGAFEADTRWGRSAGPRPPLYLTGAPWWLARGDTVSLRRLAARAAEVARDSVGVASVRGRYLHATALAYLALALGDSVDGMKLLLAIPDTLCVATNCFHEKVTLARLHAARFEYSEAAKLLDRWGAAAGSTPSAVLAALDRARIAEKMADTAMAVNRYRFVAEAWRHADPALQPYRTEALGALGRLTMVRAP